MSYEQLKLENQLCFPIYAASRLITREYQPHLDKLGITYPQYLVLLILWETDNLPVNYIAQKLLLNTNTVTPLLKRMELLDIIYRNRSKNDERQVIISLTEKGKSLQEKAAIIPQKLIETINTETISIEELLKLKTTLHHIINFLTETNKET